MKCCRILAGCILSSLCLLSFEACGQVVTEYTTGINANANPISITAGPDGNLWFTEGFFNKVGRITTAGVVTEFGTGITAAANVKDITAGADGNLWFTEINGNRIGRITTSGAVTEFSTGISANSGPEGIAAGPDGNLWFTEASGNRIGRISTSGMVTEFSTGIAAFSSPERITAGPDGNLWFTEIGGKRIGRITTAGVVTEFGSGITGTAPEGIAAGPDGNLWFTEFGGNRVGKITTGTVAGPPTLVSAVSRKTHGAAGTFDLPLSAVATNPTTEPRQGPAQTIVFTFNKTITSAIATVTEGTAIAGPPTFSGTHVTVALTGVTNQQYVTVSLASVASSDGGVGGSGSVRVGFLLGDVNQNRTVSLADLGLVNAQLAQAVTAANYLKDVNASGTLTLADKGVTNANLAKALPTP